MLFVAIKCDVTHAVLLLPDQVESVEHIERTVDDVLNDVALVRYADIGDVGVAAAQRVVEDSTLSMFQLRGSPYPEPRRSAAHSPNDSLRTNARTSGLHRAGNAGV